MCEAESAELFYSKLSGLLEKLPKYEHTNMGAPPDGSDGCVVSEACFFRGQASADWGLHSSLYRLLDTRGVFEERKINKNEKRIANAERRILDLARKNGVGRGLSALEALTVLQHHGVPTRLIDVSTDWKVALYFACETLDSVDGRLFLMATSSNRWFSDFSPRLSEDSSTLLWWDKYALSEWKQSVWPILLPFSDVRMISQRGFFLVGGLTCNYGGHNYYRGTKGSGENNQKLHNDDMRRVSSLAIEFPNSGSGMECGKRLRRFIEKRDDSKWSASALTVRVPAEYKFKIRELLKGEGVFFDSVYPPVMEVRRLLKYAGADQAVIQG